MVISLNMQQPGYYNSVSLLDKPYSMFGSNLPPSAPPATSHSFVSHIKRDPKRARKKKEWGLVMQPTQVRNFEIYEIRPS